MKDSGQQGSAGLSSVAPFKEGLTAGKPTAKSSTVKHQAAADTNLASTGQASHDGRTLSKDLEQQHRSAALAYGNRTRAKRPFRPISGMHAVAKVVAAEAAVSAAASALVPSKVQPSGHGKHHIQGHSGSTAPPPPKQQAAKPLLQAHNAGSIADPSTVVPGGSNAAGSSHHPVAVSSLQVQGHHTGPRKGSKSLPGALVKGPAGADAAGALSWSGSSLALSSVPASFAGGAAASPEQLPTHSTSTSGEHLIQAQGLLQALSLSSVAAGVTAAGLHSSAAAQLAALGISKRLRAQLRSAHGPPPFQRGALAPRPASPPPVVLDAAMICAHGLDAGTPAAADIAMADLSSCSISTIAVPDGMTEGDCPAATDAANSAAPQGVQDQQLSLLSFPNLVSLDLSDNRLECFAGLAVLSSLQQLNLSANRLRNLQGLQQLLDTGADSCRQSSSSSSCLHAVQSQGTEGLQQQEASVCNEQASYQLSAHSSQNALQPEGQPLHCLEQGQQDEGQGQQGQQLESQNSQQGQSSAGQSCCFVHPTADLCGGYGRVPTAALYCFTSLQVLDVSYNLLSGEQLLGHKSPLGMLPRLAELHAAGNNIASLPAHLAPFTSLTRLNLQHNQLQMAAVAALGQLLVLQELDLGHNPLNGPAHCIQPVAQDNPSVAPPNSQKAFQQLQVLDLCSSRVKQLQPVQELIGYMEVLSVLNLVHTPLVERCRSGKVQEQDLLRPGLTVILTSSTSSTSGTGHGTAQRSRQIRSMQCHEDRVPVLKIPEAASSSKVLAAASKATLASLPHEQLVAAFDRVAAGIDSWQQLAPVLEEEGSWDCQEYEGGGTLGGQQKGHGGGDKAAYPGEEAETIEDKTFLTGVGITGELPGDSGQDASSSQASAHDQTGWQDPTERVALALGLAVSQLAHMTGRTPGNPDGALHRLRHALTHPLVDPDAGQRPEQHHMRPTAAAAAKQHQGHLKPLAQPISPSLTTRVEQVQDLGSQLQAMRGRLTAMQGSLLPQLQAQAIKMASGSVPAAASSRDSCVGQARCAKPTGL